MTEPIRFGDLYKENKDALKPLPDGEYMAVVSDAEATKSQNDKPMIRLKLLVTTAAGTKKMVATQMTVSVENPTALGIFFRQMEAFGIGADYWASNPTLEQVANVMRDKSIRVVLGTSTWNDQPRNDVKNYLAPLGGPQIGAVAPAAVIGQPGPATPLGGSMGPGPTASPVVNEAAKPTTGPVAF